MRLSTTDTEAWCAKHRQKENGPGRRLSLNKKGRVLLVRERGSRSFSLPGGGIERGESTVEAALRELREETQLAPVKAERLFDHEGATQMHKVVWVLTKGRVRLQRREVSEYLWWDGKEQVSMLPSAKDIISKHRKARR